MSTQSDTRRPLGVRPGTAALAGIAVPLVFIPIVVLLTVAEYEFLRGLGWHPYADHQSIGHWPSALARGPYGWLQSLNFLLAGALSLLFLAGLRSQFRPGGAGRVAVVALGAFGGAAVLNAFPTSLEGETGTWAAVGLIHFIGFLITMASGVVGTVAAGLALRGQPGWRGWWVYSLLTGPAVPATMVLPGDTGFYLVLVLLFGWFGVMGWRLRQVTRA